MTRRPLVFAMTGAKGVFGGIAVANLNVLQALVELSGQEGRALTVLSLLESDADRPVFVPTRVTFRAFAGNRRRFVASLIAALVRRPIFCFDHVHLSVPLLPFTWSGIARSVIFAHGSESWRRLRPVSRRCFSSAVLCLTNSHFTLRKMRERIPSLRGQACPLGLSPDVPLNAELPTQRPAGLTLEAADAQVRPLGSQVLLLVGRMHSGERQKGYDALLAVIPAVLKEFPDVQVVVAGPGDDRERVVALAQDLGIASSVFLPGWVPLDTLSALYASCYAFVMPSRQEGFGLAYLEAMNYAKPCVGCRDQGAEDIIVDGETGFLVSDVEDAAELEAIVCRLLRDPVAAHRFGVEGFRRLHRLFTADQYRQRVRAAVASVA